MRQGSLSGATKKANPVKIAGPVVIGLGSNGDGKSLCLWLKDGPAYVRKEMDKDTAVDLATRILIEVRALARLSRPE